MLQETTPIPLLTEKPAGIWPRFWAAILDSLILTIPTAIIFWILVRVITPNNQTYGMIYLALYLCYSIYLVGKKGATIGKHAFGMQIIHFTSRGNVTFLNAALREVVKTVTSYIPFLGVLIFIINTLMVIFSKNKRGLHDLAAQTQVVINKPPWPLKKRVLTFVGLIVAALFLFSIVPTIQP